MFNLHYPPLSKHLIEEMLDICEDESNNKDAIKKRMFSPFHDQITTTPDLCRKMSTDTQRGRSKSKVGWIFLIYSNIFYTKKGTGKSSKKRKKETEIEKLKRLKLEETPKAKKPINLKKATPIRKRLQPTVNQMLEDDPVENPEPVSSKKKNKEAIAYDDVYTRKEISDKQSTSIQKIRQLQQNELQCIMDHGTYVQCCDCNKWRCVLPNSLCF